MIFYLLFSKESILEHLLDQTISENCSHIASLKNVKELKLFENSGYNKSTPGCHDQYYDTQVAKYVCPVVGESCIFYLNESCLLNIYLFSN